MLEMKGDCARGGCCLRTQGSLRRKLTSFLYQEMLKTGMCYPEPNFLVVAARIKVKDRGRHGFHCWRASHLTVDTGLSSRRKSRSCSQCSPHTLLSTWHTGVPIGDQEVVEERMMDALILKTIARAKFSMWGHLSRA